MRIPQDWKLKQRGSGGYHIPLSEKSTPKQGMPYYTYTISTSGNVYSATYSYHNEVIPCLLQLSHTIEGLKWVVIDSLLVIGVRMLGFSGEVQTYTFTQIHTVRMC